MINLKFLFAIALVIPLFQNCGQAGNSPPETIACLVSRLAPKLFINGTALENVPRPIVLPVGQNISFGYASPSTGVVSCGPTSGEPHWLMNGGSRVNDFCAILASPAAGSYTIKFVGEHMDCEQNPVDYMTPIEFTVQ